MDVNNNYDLKEIVYFCEYHNEYRTEVFKDIPNYEGMYQVSDLGRVKSFKKLNVKILKNKIDTKGYQNVCLCCIEKKYIRVGQLVCMAFLNHRPDGTQKYVVDHKNRVRNDDRLINLQIITQRNNVSKDKNNKHGFIGVDINTGGRFSAKLRINGVVTHIGSYDTAEEAHNAYLKRSKLDHEEKYK